MFTEYARIFNMVRWNSMWPERICNTVYVSIFVRRRVTLCISGGVSMVQSNRRTYIYACQQKRLSLSANLPGTLAFFHPTPLAILDIPGTPAKNKTQGNTFPAYASRVYTLDSFWPGHSAVSAALSRIAGQ